MWCLAGKLEFMVLQSVSVTFDESCSLPKCFKYSRSSFDKEAFHKESAAGLFVSKLTEMYRIDILKRSFEILMKMRYFAFTLKNTKLIFQESCQNSFIFYFPVWLNGWVFVYELSVCGFESRCCHLCVCSAWDISTYILSFQRLFSTQM